MPPLINNLYSRSYAEDVTSVTSGASQGPHSFNLVFVCVFVCLCHAWRYPVSVPYCTVPAKTAGHNIFVCLCHRHARRYPVPVPYHQEYGTIKRMSIYAKCMGGMHSVQYHKILCGFVCEAEIPLAGWLGRLSTSPGIACRPIA